MRLNPHLVTSENAIIVMDEINDVCWLWIGRNVSMPTRMHALRMSKSLQRSGYKVGITTIGMASSRIAEMNEKNDSDRKVAEDIAAFRTALHGKFLFEDKFLAFPGKKMESSEPIPGSPEAARAQAPRPEPKPAIELKPPAAEPEPVPEPVPELVQIAKPAPKLPGSLADRKTAFLLLATMKNADLVYTERFERNGKLGIKIEAPGTMVIEVITDGDDIIVSPADFGDTDDAARIKLEYESWVEKF
ncbi:MAG: hypothetical protein KAU89_01055 [Candidatus Thorarchaeota archaeon]|nr:hypothetical protein [Candidatus Thorarchaeota archaeon]